jgi:hypothetical protein
MKSCLLLLLLMLCTYFPLKAQMNLVPNSSFEDVAFCPNGLGQINLANYWNNHGITPDLFCQCSPSGVNVPDNVLNYQFANSNYCMAGLITFIRANGPSGPDAREYIGSELIQPLVIGTKYYFSCYINYAFNQTNNVASNKFGMKLLTNILDTSANIILTDNEPMVFSDSIITDTLSWVKIQGSFLADSAYVYIALGNFFVDNQTDTTSFGPFPYPYQSYYFLDDICLSTDSAYCDNMDIQS